MCQGKNGQRESEYRFALGHGLLLCRKEKNKAERRVGKIKDAGQPKYMEKGERKQMTILNNLLTFAGSSAAGGVTMGC